MDYRRHEEENRGGRRDWSDRAGDEVRSWLGDDQARARREYDEREERFRSGSGGGEYRDYRYGGEQGTPRGREFNTQRGDDYGRRAESGYERFGQGRSGSEPGYAGSNDRSFGGGAANTQSYGQGYGSQSVRGFDQGRDSDFYGPSGRQWSGGMSGGYGNGGRMGGGFGRSSWDREGEWDSGSGATEQWGRGGNLTGGREQQGFFGRGPKGYQRSDDRIREDVCDRLTDESSVDASEIAVQVQGGEVTLTGSVSSRDQKRRAEDVVERISGVNEVVNNLRVARQERDGRTDQETTTRTQGQPKSGTSKTSTSAGGVS